MVRRAALLVLLAVPLLCVATTDATAQSRTPESVTLPLDQYNDLFRQAHLKENERKLADRKHTLEREFDAKVARLNEEQKSWKDGQAQRSNRAQVLRETWCLTNHSAAGVYHAGTERPEERSAAAFDFALDLHIFEDAWTAIPIVDAQTILASDIRVTRKVDDFEKFSGWEPVHLGADMLVALKERDQVPDMRDYMMLTNRSGAYRVTFRVYIRVPITRSLHTLTLNLLHPLTATTLRLQYPDNSPRSSSIKELSVDPAAFHEVVEGPNSTDISLRLPSTKTVEMKWRFAPNAGAAGRGRASQKDTVAASAESEPEQAPQATVMHHSLHSVAEGLLHSESSFKYVLDMQQSLSSVDIVVLGGARVTSVTAFGLLSWRAVPVANFTIPGDGEIAAPHNGTAVQISFRSSVISKEVIVVVNTELEFDASAGHVELPQLVCQNVLRQTGSIAVVKDASVEVYEHQARSAMRVGVADVPAHIRGRTDRPIVVAYKFLSPRHSVSLSVLQHQEIQTLETVVDTALYQVLVTDTQKMHVLSMVLQNSQRQYTAVRDIPASATLWSLRVNTLSTAPVRGNDGTLMVPLLVGTGGGSNEGGLALKTSVELAWMSNHGGLGENGTMVISPPRVDVPVSALSLELQFPELYMVNFTGTLSRVPTFSHRQPYAVNYQTDKHVVEQDFDFGAAPRGPKQADKASVKASIPRQGRRYRFEQILVVGDGAILRASYAANRTTDRDASTWWEWRPW